MKKRLGLLLAVSAMALGLGGAFAVSQNNNKIETAQAVTYSRIYYVGTDNNWRNPSGDMTGYTFQYVGEYSDGHYYSLDIALTKDSQFKLRDWEDGHNVDWMNTYDGTRVLEGLRNADGSDPNLMCTMTGTYRITYRFKNQNDRCIVGFDLLNSTQMYYVADNTTWAQSGQIYIHAWNKDGDLTNWSASYPIHKTTTVKVGPNSYDFYVVNVASNATSMIIKHYDNDTDYKTGTLGLSGGSCFTSNSTADMGNAGAIVADVYSKLAAATYQGKSYTNSICGITASDRATIVGHYNALNSNAKSIVDASKLHTYNPENMNETIDVSYAEIMNTLSRHINLSSGRLLLLSGFGTDNPGEPIVVVVAFLLAGVSIGGYFLLRKKRIL